MILQIDLISIFYLLATEPKAKHESVHECVFRERERERERLGKSGFKSTVN
jgi:hypothetical protein